MPGPSFSANWLKTGEATFECWVKMPNPRTKPLAIFSVGNSTSNYMLLGVRPSAAGTNPGKLELRATGTAISKTAVSESRIDDNAWHHIALVLSYFSESTMLEYYIDGKYDSGALLSKEFIKPSTWTTTYLGDVSRFLSGYDSAGSPMDEIAVFNKPLSDERIKAHSSLVKPSIDLAAVATVNITGSISMRTNLIISPAATVGLKGNISFSSLKAPLPFALSSLVTRKGFIDYRLSAKTIKANALLDRNYSTTLQIKKGTRLK